jgi:hypothetical protein
MEPRAKSRLAWPGLPPWSLEARALLSKLDLGNGPASVGRFSLMPTLVGKQSDLRFADLQLDLKKRCLRFSQAGGKGPL